MDEIITAAVIGTSAMTLFSYIIASFTDQPYKEPLLLAFVLERFHMQKGYGSNILGWTLHYLIGILFVIPFHIMLKTGLEITNYTGAVLFGSTIGFAGIVGWIILFSIFRTKPVMNYIGYYVQLFVAHLVFAFGVVAAYTFFCY